MSKSRFIELMSKSIDKSANEEELLELEEFLKNFPDYRRLHQVTDALEVKFVQSDSKLMEKDVDRGLSELWTKIKNSSGAPALNTDSSNRVLSIANWRWIARVAAVITLIFVSALLYYYKSKGSHENNIMVSVNVPFGKSVQLTLPDGSKVKLNAGSHFSYASKFSGKTRDVNLEGEGFFEVTKNPDKPFLVHTQNLTVKVLGTVFNVKAYNEDKNVETTLLKGKVLIELNNDPEQKIILLPHEKLTVNNTPILNSKGTQHDEVTKVKYLLTTLEGNAEGEYKESAWINDKIVFTNDYFEDVTKQIERKYNVHIMFEDQALKREQISGVIKNETLEDVFKLLKQITAFKYRIDNQNIYLSGASRR